MTYDEAFDRLKAADGNQTATRYAQEAMAILLMHQHLEQKPAKLGDAVPVVQFEREPDEGLLDDFPTGNLSDWEDERLSRPFPY